MRLRWLSAARTAAYAAAVSIDVVVINGGSSSGKTTLARRLQSVLPEVWLRFSVDDLVAALPSDDDHDTIRFAADGAVLVGDGFRQAEAAWVAGLAAIARAGTGVIVDDVFLDGADSQAPLRDGLAGLRMLWVGVHCDPAVAVAREAARGDRIVGMAAAQAVVVHAGVRYDVEVDTSAISAEHAVHAVLAAMA